MNKWNALKLELKSIIHDKNEYIEIEKQYLKDMVEEHFICDNCGKELEYNTGIFDMLRAVCFCNNYCSEAYEEAMIAKGALDIDD